MLQENSVGMSSFTARVALHRQAIELVSNFAAQAVIAIEHPAA
jgi:hypothetical protein